MASILWAMPPMPGSGLTHDGSVFPEESPAGLRGPALAYGSSANSSSAKVDISASTTGNKTILVILAAFPDLDFNSGITAQTHDAAYYSNRLQGPSGFTMKQYYLDQSRNKLNLSFLVLGKYTADFGYSYYGANDILGNDVHPEKLVAEMLNNAKAEAEASGVNLDNCAVIIVHAGPGEEVGSVSADYIWSHRSSLTKKGASTVTIDGKVFNDYIIVPEYNSFRGSAEATIGVFCHEFGHILGLVDIYDTTGATSGVGQWSLMGGGSWGSVGKAGVASGTDPAPLMAWERLALGWIDEEQIAEIEGANSYSFSEMNSENKVYTVKLTDNQFLLLEGKEENMTGTGMFVPETGLLITQMHKEILTERWSTNRVNNGSYRPHGVMVLEAVAENYKTKGLGNLWRTDSTANRFTTTALFRSSTLTSVGPSEKSASASIPFLPIFIDTIMASGALIGMLAAWYAGRRKLCAAVAVAMTAICISMGCSISAGSDPETHDTGPTTNYYTSTTEVYSKTGSSGVTIYDINCNSDGSGSFTIKRGQ